MSTLRLLLLFLIGFLSSAESALSVEAGQEVPLVIGNRTVHVFRAPLGMFSAEERAEGARRRIELAFEHSGEGWTSVKPVGQGLQLELDGKPMFLVLPGDASSLAGETPEDLANQASRVLQKAWSESRERRDPRATLHAALTVGVATLLFGLGLVFSVKLIGRARRALVRKLASWTNGKMSQQLGHHILLPVPALADRGLLLMTWLLGMFLAFVFLTFSLGQFATTRPASESLLNSIGSMGGEAVTAIAASLPGIFIALLIFLAVWVVTRLSTEFFRNVESKPTAEGKLNSHTAPATRRIVNASLWLFAVAMAYPYLPGSHTEAFKGLSVLLGLMVSIGASGVVGQIASGVIIVYTYALKKGEYVRILDHEGTVSELSLFVTRLRTGLGEEVAIPNAVVLGNVTRNFSRVLVGTGYMLDASVTIGYDTPWRQVHAILLEAAKAVPEILPLPPAYVVQTSLSDFYVAYKLVVHVDTEVPATRARVASDLHAAIQDAFNRYGVQIMSPHYYGDPVAPKRVAESEQCPAPAVAEPKC